MAEASKEDRTYAIEISPGNWLVIRPMPCESCAQAKQKDQAREELIEFLRVTRH